jgi:serine/threonine protein kinase
VVRSLRQSDPCSFGRYRLLARIGTGGMAVVYFGRSVSGRAVAVKAVHAELAEDETYRDRFRREVAATRAAGGRYSPSVVDADLDAAVPWLAMEFLPAVSLREVVTRHGPLTTESAWPFAAGVVEAIASIQRARVVHLDLKPANILLTADGARVIDFGIASIGVPATTPGGTPGFRSPEQAGGAEAGPASDVFAFGATLAYAVTGTAPSGTTPPAIPDAALREVITSCLREDPADRPTVPELTESLAHPPGVDWPPSAVRAEIARRTEEAEHLLATPPPEPTAQKPNPPPERTARRLSRRAVLTSGAAVVLTGGAVAVSTLLRDRPVPGAATPEPNTDTPSSTSSTPTTSIAPIDTPRTRPMEVVLAGTLLLRTMTLSVNRRTVRSRTDLQLPWTTYVDVPAEEPITWRIDYRCPAGDLSWSVGIADHWLDPGTRTLTDTDNVGYLTGTH